jgi:hypothetical protein
VGRLPRIAPRGELIPHYHSSRGGEEEEEEERRRRRRGETLHLK